MTIRTKCTLSCDIGLKCTKDIVRTVEGRDAAAQIRQWATSHGWKSYGGRDACPECWKALHAPTVTEEPTTTPDSPSDRWTDQETRESGMGWPLPR